MPPRRLATLVAVFAATVTAALGAPSPAALAAPGRAALARPALLPEPAFHRIHFPVEGPVSYGDDFHSCRSGCTKIHGATDIMGTKLQRLLAAVDGTVTYVREDSGNTAGNMMVIKGADGWKYSYIHLNNDTPGTDDGANPPEWRFAPGIEVGAEVKAGDHVGYLGDSGNAEGTAPHLHFEMHDPTGAVVNPWTSLRLAQGLPAGGRCAFPENPDPEPSAASGAGYWTLGSDGGIFTYGDAAFHGSTGGMRLNRPVEGMAATPTGDGYWLVASDGGIFSFGDATFHGSTGAIALNQPIVAMAPTPGGKGYWLVASDGGIFSFGDATFHGSTGAIALNQPIVAMAPTPTGDGYWLVASDGGIFSFGDATFHGSTGAIALNQPIVAMAPTPTGDGYWLLAADGGVFAFGDALPFGSLPGHGLCEWTDAAGIVASATGDGYWIQGVDGSVWPFGDARFEGDAAALGIRAIGLTAVRPRQ
ncbi:MAG: M23 family metallopeptidase [Acidimicrobiia bacterium]|nr:M23 family metallopeptidase [Acidimicrobiia bacterium]